MSERQENLYLSDIDDAIVTVFSYTRGMSYEEFVNDRKTREAVILNFVILGEAVKNLPPAVTEQCPDIPWREFAGMRDKMVHGYFSISTTILWETIKNDLPPLASAVQTLLRRKR